VISYSQSKLDRKREYVLPLVPYLGSFSSQGSPTIVAEIAIVVVSLNGDDGCECNMLDNQPLGRTFSWLMHRHEGGAEAIRHNRTKQKFEFSADVSPSQKRIGTKLTRAYTKCAIRTIVIRTITTYSGSQ
jgi:hypothetical protein